MLATVLLLEPLDVCPSGVFSVGWLRVLNEPERDRPCLDSSEFMGGMAVELSSLSSVLSSRRGGLGPQTVMGPSREGRDKKRKQGSLLRVPDCLEHEEPLLLCP